MKTVDGIEWACEGSELRTFFKGWTVSINLGICHGNLSCLVCFHEGRDMSKAYRSFRRDSLGKCLKLASEAFNSNGFSELREKLDEIPNN